MKLIHVPIELLEERYSLQWYKWFTTEFEKDSDIDVINILPKTGRDSKIVNGQFLDVIQTNAFKAEQLQWICKLFEHNRVTEDTVFLFSDAWFPGLEMLAYIRNALKIPFKIIGIVHAGTWDPFDYLTQMDMRDWAKYFEFGWFSILDAICVATEFHKELILKNVPLTKNGKNSDLKKKIKVTGLPIYPDFVNEITKKNIVVFPHRLAPEKNPQMFEQLADAVSKELPEWKFIRSKDVCNSKQEYYELLNTAKIAVSFADQETFGIAMIEATLCGCIPVVPDRLSYSELYTSKFRIVPTLKNNKDIVASSAAIEIEKAKRMIVAMATMPHRYSMELHYQQQYLINRCSVAISNILNECKEVVLS